MVKGFLERQILSQGNSLICRGIVLLHISAVHDRSNIIVTNLRDTGNSLGSLVRGKAKKKSIIFKPLLLLHYPL